MTDSGNIVTDPAVNNAAAHKKGNKNTAIKAGKLRGNQIFIKGMSLKCKIRNPFHPVKVSMLSYTQTLICSVVKGYLLAYMLQPEVLIYLENLYQGKMIGLRNYA